mmetsp:Transcript_29798/g.81441  ORF Transcript_29798/g.81441 Transcript_29798/m.81441 type:complete len:81 (+) Transcript_29798:151-393(+)
MFVISCASPINHRTLVYVSKLDVCHILREPARGAREEQAGMREYPKPSHCVSVDLRFKRRAAATLVGSIVSSWKFRFVFG